MLVAARLAEGLGLDEQVRSDTFYAALIQPVGCTAFTYEGARLVGTNELKGIPAYVRRGTARLREGLRAMQEEVSGEPLGRAARGLFKELTAGRRLLDYVVRADCEAGTRFTERIGFPDSVARVVLQVHERWDGGASRPGSAARRWFRRARDRGRRPGRDLPPPRWARGDPGDGSSASTAGSIPPSSKRASVAPTTSSARTRGRPPSGTPCSPPSRRRRSRCRTGASTILRGRSPTWST